VVELGYRVGAVYMGGHKLHLTDAAVVRTPLTVVRTANAVGAVAVKLAGGADCSFDGLLKLAADMRMRIPTTQEVRDFLQSKVCSSTAGMDAWSPSLTDEERDWIQIGDTNHPPGKSHVQGLGFYPAWDAGRNWGHAWVPYVIFIETSIAEARASAAAAEATAVEAEAKARQERQAAEAKAGMQKIWRRYDKDGNGMLDANEVKPLMLDVLGALIILQQNDKIKAQNKGDKDSIISCNVIIESLEQEKASMRRQSAEKVAQDLMVGQNDILGNKHGLDKNNDHKISHEEFCSGFKQWFDNKKSMGEMNNLDAIMNAQLQEAMKGMFG